MKYHSTPSSVSNNDRTHFSFQGIEYEVDPETGGARIPLHSGKYPGLFALVHTEDVPLVARYRWNRLTSRDALYARSSGTNYVLMHRLIVGVADRSLFIDHINHNGLDNRRCNLRIATSTENGYNRRPNRNASSRFKGVRWIPSKSRWYVFFKVDGKERFVGSFVDEIEAAKAYDNAVRTLHGEYAYLNFPYDRDFGSPTEPEPTVLVDALCQWCRKGGA